MEEKEKDLVQLGENLREARESKKQSLEKIANRTKININFLRNMEAGKFDFLPELFVRNFLKMYIKELGRDVEKFLNTYDAIVSSKKPDHETITDDALKQFEAEQSQPDLFSKIKDFVQPYLRRKKFIWLGVGFVCVILIVFSLINGDNNHSAYLADSTSAGIGSTNSVHKNTLDTSALSVASKLFNHGKKLSLELETLEKTWLQIAIDDSAAKDYIFDTGKEARWEAKEKYLIRIGNGGGIRLYLNGVDLGQLGEQGEVVTLLLNKDGIQDSSL